MAENQELKANAAQEAAGANAVLLAIKTDIEEGRS